MYLARSPCILGSIYWDPGYGHHTVPVAISNVKLEGGNFRAHEVMGWCHPSWSLVSPWKGLYKHTYFIVHVCFWRVLHRFKHVQTNQSKMSNQVRCVSSNKISWFYRYGNFSWVQNATSRNQRPNTAKITGAQSPKSCFGLSEDCGNIWHTQERHETLWIPSMEDVKSQKINLNINWLNWQENICNYAKLFQLFQLVHGNQTRVGISQSISWLVVSTHLKNISQHGNLPQFSGWKWNIFETNSSRSSFPKIP